MSSTVSPASTSGFANAHIYDQHRPSYPLDAAISLLKHLQIQGLKGARVLDLGAGTGKFTELLADRVEEYKIIAIEPHDHMRSELERKRLKNVKVSKGEANNMTGIENQSMDAVVTAQESPITYDHREHTTVSEYATRLLTSGNFRLFTDKAALNEIYRVIAPGGILGMIWNIEDYNAPKSWTAATEWEERLKDIVWSYGNEYTVFRHERWQHVFEQQLESTPLSIQQADPLFSLPLGQESHHWTHWLTKEALWERFHSLSQFAVQEEPKLTDIKQQVMDIFANRDIETNSSGEIAFHGTTFMAWTAAIPGAPLKDGG